MREEDLAESENEDVQAKKRRYHNENGPLLADDYRDQAGDKGGYAAKGRQQHGKGKRHIAENSVSAARA